MSFDKRNENYLRLFTHKSQLTEVPARRCLCTDLSSSTFVLDASSPSEYAADVENSKQCWASTAANKYLGQQAIVIVTICCVMYDEAT
jgi:hypothetical protein